MKKGFYRFMRSIACFLRALLFPLDAEGLENLNVDGGAMLLCNHVSLLDPILLAVLCKRPMRFMGKKELFEKKLAGKILRAVGGFPVDRDAADVAAIRTSMTILRDGDILCVFPQGHRFPDDSGHEIKNGASLLAIWSKTPAIPIHITPPYRLFHKLKVRVGAPVDLSDLTKTDQATLEIASRRIEKAIWSN